MWMNGVLDPRNEDLTAVRDIVDTGLPPEDRVVWLEDHYQFNVKIPMKVPMQSRWRKFHARLRI